MIKEDWYKNKETPSVFSQDVQSIVAKLLSKENIQVHRSLGYRTAFFDIESRMLGLPVLKYASPAVYDLLIGHEVGHALYTEMANFESFRSKFGERNKYLYNVLEDIRIEKLIQETYPGLIRLFKSGYTELWERNFFGTKDTAKVNKMGLLDRINLIAKLGSNTVPINFEPIEKAILDEALSIKTHDDVVRVAELLLGTIEKEKESESGAESDDSSNESEPNTESDSFVDSDDVRDGKEESTSKSSNGESGEDGESSSEVEPDGTDSPTDSEVGNGSNCEGGSPYPSLESETQKAFDQSMEDNAIDDKEYVSENGNFEFEFIPPSINSINRVVFSYKELFEIRKNDERYKHNFRSSASSFDHVSGNYVNDREKLLSEKKKFMNSIKKKVILLRNEFEQRKAATEYVRAKVSRRGTLDVNRLYRYKFSEDVFSSIMSLSSAKSHGMFFLIDVSGSMHSTIPAVICNLIILAEFCKSVGIPFQVYTFTSSDGSHELDTPNHLSPYFRKIQKMNRKVVNGEICVDDLKLVEVLSSEMTKNEYNQAIEDLYRMVMTHNTPSNFESMGSTPLLEAIVVSTKLISEFKKRTQVQIVNLVVLSDGEGSQIEFHADDKAIIDKNGYSRSLKEKNQPYKRLGGICYGRLFGSKKIKLFSKNPRIGFAYRNNMRAILENLYTEFNVNSICFFVSGSIRSGMASILEDLSRAECGYFDEQKIGQAMTYWPGPVEAKLKTELKKNQILAIENAFGFKKYILMIMSDYDTVIDNGFSDWRGDISFENDASEASIRKSFMEYAKNNRAPKKFAKEFVETVCSNL